MKRYDNLWSDIVDYENLIISARKAQKGKRFRPNVLQFNYNLEQELEHLQTTLVNKTYQPGKYRTFQIREPKPRMISAAPYRDRVVHHALCNIIIPIFERTFIYHSYANRVGFGTHRALKTFTQFAHCSQYVLQCDIRKYFPNIDHTILKQLIRRKIKCSDTLWLIDAIIDNSNDQKAVYEYFPGDTLLTPLERRKGLPIGNLTSQFFANIYLNGFDHFVHEELKFNRYVRYVDDFCLFSNDRQELLAARVAIEHYLESLRLKIHPVKSQLMRTCYGVNFVGFRVFPTHIRVRSKNLNHGRYRLRRLMRAYARGTLSLEKIRLRLQSWFAHLQHADSFRLQQMICKLISLPQPHNQHASLP